MNNTQGGWNGTWSQRGKNVTGVSLSWNATVATNGTVAPAADFTYSGANVDPASFTVNEVACTGGAGARRMSWRSRSRSREDPVQLSLRTAAFPSLHGDESEDCCAGPKRCRTDLPPVG